MAGEESPQAGVPVPPPQICHGIPGCLVVGGRLSPLPVGPAQVQQPRPGPVPGHSGADRLRVCPVIHVADQSLLYRAVAQGRYQRVDELPVAATALIMNGRVQHQGGIRAHQFQVLCCRPTDRARFRSHRE